MTINPIMRLFNEKTPEVKNLSQILMGHAAFQILNAGCELKVFEKLYQSPGLTKHELNNHLKLDNRPLNLILLGLCSLGLLNKKEDKYFNSDTIQEIFKNDFWKIFYDIVVFENKIVYLGQYDFIESLKTNSNVGLKRVEGKGETLYHRFAESEELRSAFYNYMSSWSQMSIPLLIDTGVFKECKKILDVGGGDATNAIEIAKSNPSSKIYVFELKENSPVAINKISSVNFQNQISLIEGDIFKTDFGTGYDCIAFIHQLVIWSKEQIIFLLTKAYNSLEQGGSLVIYNSITKDEENGPLFGALDSVYFMSIPACGGMIYPWKFYEECLTKSGFSTIQRIELNTWSPHGVIIAKK